jgi:hypothetical protein
MRDLFLSECQRFRQAALIAATVHLLLQIAVARMGDPLRWHWQVSLIALAAYMACGLGFALYQVGSYRQGGRWIWLLHRPLARGAVFGAIALAACALIVFVVGLPALLTVFIEDLTGMRTVDTRHYLLVLQLVLFVLCAWLIGSYISIGRSRSAAVVLVLPFVLLMHNAAGWVMLAPAVACVALLAYVVYASFKPNRLAPPDGGVAIAATAAPLLVGFYWALLWSGALLFQGALMLTHRHPHNMAVAPVGGINEATRLMPDEYMQRSVAASNDARAPRWREEIAASGVRTFRKMGDQYPVRDQLTNTDKLAWTDERRHTTWTFSHDAMRFEGSDSVTDAPRGWLGLAGIGDSTPFPGVPVMPGPGNIMTAHALRTFDGASGRTIPIVALGPTETLIATPDGRDAGTTFMLTNRRLIAYQPGSPRREVASVALPGRFGDLAWTHMASVKEGRLVSFTFGSRMVDGGAAGAQTLILMAPDGSNSIVAARALTHDYPALFEHKDWWLSPLLYSALALPNALLDTGMVLDAGQTRDDEALLRARPQAIWLAALVAALISSAAAYAWLRPVPLSAGRRAAWIAACFVFGLPCLPTLLILQPRRATAPPA